MARSEIDECAPQEQFVDLTIVLESDASSSLPHGGLRPFHQKSSCLHAIIFRALCGANLVTLHLGIEGQRRLCSLPCGDARAALGQALVFRSKVREFVPRAQHVNLRDVVEETSTHD